jgi:cell division protease FtsH
MASSRGARADRRRPGAQEPRHLDARRRIIAYHEGGHAVVQRILPKCDPVAKVTIISRGMALGYTMALPRRTATSSQDRVRGQDRRAARRQRRERLIFGDTTTGASNDIEKATDLARRMVTEFGMSDKLGPLSFGKRDELVFLGREIGEQRNYSDEVAKTIDDEVRAIIDKAYERATEVLTTHRDKLVALAEKLVAEETVDAEAFETLVQRPAAEAGHPRHAVRDRPRTARPGAEPTTGVTRAASPAAPERRTKRAGRPARFSILGSAARRRPGPGRAGADVPTIPACQRVKPPR